jgi:hypothetical protein
MDTLRIVRIILAATAILLGVAVVRGITAALTGTAGFVMSQQAPSAPHALPER